MMTSQFEDNVEIQGSRDVTQLRVQSDASQQQPLQEWQNNAGDPLARVTNDGRLQVGDFDPVEPGAMATADALIEAHRDVTSGKPKRGLHTLGRIGGAIQDAIKWALHELELSGDEEVSGAQTALHSRITNQNTGDSTQAQLRAASFEAVNETGSVGQAVGEVTGVRIIVTNGPDGVLETSVGLDVEMNQDTGGATATAYGLRIGDIDQGSNANYALHTGQGIVHLGDAVELAKPDATPDAPATNLVRLYPKADGKLYAKNWENDEFDLTAQVLDDLIDVDTTTMLPTDGQALVWSEATGIWRPDTVAGGSGGGSDASTTSYTPDDSAHWENNVDPGNVDDALDQLADRVDVLENMSNAEDVIYAPTTNADWTEGVPENVQEALDTLASRGGSISYTPPDNGDFFWVNQNSATVNTEGGILHLSRSTTPATQITARIFNTNVPTAPWRLTAALQFKLIGVNYSIAGLVFRESSSGKLVTFSMCPTYGPVFSEKWNSPTSFAGDYFGSGIFGAPLWWRLEDNGTNRICSWSNDGVNFLTLHSVSRTDFLTADQVGISLSQRGSASVAGVSVLSWLLEDL